MMKKTTLFLVCCFLITALQVNAQYTAIPDSNFEAALSAYDDIANDNQVPTANINTLTVLDVSNKNISDLTGIQDFTALTNLNCANNQLTSLDVSNNTALDRFFCSSNQLTTLDVSNNTALEMFHCSGNQLTALDVSNNTALFNLVCSSNQFTALDVSNNTALKYLDFSNNQLTALDVSANTMLTNLICVNNQLTSLDVSNNTALVQLQCYDNQLTSLDLSSNTALTGLNCYNNQLIALNVKNGNNTSFNYLQANNNTNLTCIQVDNAAYSTTNWTGSNFLFDSTTSFNENCSSTLGTVNFTTKDAGVYIHPNPVNERLNIKTNDAVINAVNIYSMTGKQVYTGTATTIDVSHLPAGVYLVKVTLDNGVEVTKKIVKL